MINQNISATTDVRRFGYYIPKSNGTLDFVVVDKIADEEVLAELNEIVNVVFTLQPVIISFEILEKNFQELFNALDSHRLKLNDLPKSQFVPMPVLIEGIILAGQKISNFLSSAFAFLAQTDRQLRIIHGADSPELNYWDEERKNLHSNHFSYRFLYELRNFAQHRSLPLSNFNVSGNRSLKDDSMQFNTGATIMRDGLLSDGYDWGKIKKEIQRQPTEFDLLPLIEDYLHCLCQLCLEAVKLQNFKLAECARYFDVIRKLLGIPVGSVPVMYVGDSDSAGIPPLNFEVIPMEQFSYLLNKYNLLLKACET